MLGLELKHACRLKELGKSRAADEIHVSPHKVAAHFLRILQAHASSILQSWACYYQLWGLDK